MMTARPASRAIAVGAIVLLAGTLSACVGKSDPAPAPSTAGPLEEFFSGIYASFDDGDQNALMIKSEEVVASCMADLGFEYTPVDYSSQDFSPQDESTGPDEEWGTLGFAKKYGYGATTSPGGTGSDEPVDAGTEQVDPNSAYVEAMSEAESQAYYAALYGEQTMSTDDEEGMGTEYDWTTAGCQGKAQHDVFDAAYGTDDSTIVALQEEMSTMYESQSQDARIAAVDSSWAACMDEAGYPGFAAADDAQSSFYDKLNALQTEAYAGLDDATATEEEYAAASEKVTKAQSALTEEEIATATADFTCRDKVKYTEKLQEVQFEYEQEFVDSHREALEAWKASMAAAQG